MASSVLWHDYRTERVSARVAVLEQQGYIISECHGNLDGPLAQLMVSLCEPIFQSGQPLGSFHVWDARTYETAFRTVWFDCMRKWGGTYFRDLNVYVPPGLARMGMSVAATLRIGDIVIYKSEDELLKARLDALGV